ncbi:alpha-hydroxy acid oxidase [Nocardioides sp. GY 10127]|uniref:alpha-hydroxy acid oxidase n=1 Tax=Nocardioides sp. GY 10127 TaxID=2569762 RepID=UPI0010A928FE|nr:alpha-hydroxy acid oxidase [Nocardioides sp. GY 10127]TIC83942.1 alpha-hydroxy-acid oxidizing protein [Nocardioides sp. GY 10127]
MTWQERVAEHARGAMTPEVWDYVAHGSGGGATLAESGPAWGSLRLWPRVLREVTQVSVSTTLLGTEARCWGVAPTSLQVAVHPDGDLGTARACAAAGAVMTVSSNTGTLFSDIAATDVAWWLQVYLPADRTLALPLLESAVAHGARGVVLTVDTPVVASWSPRGASVWDVVPPGSAHVNFEPGFADQPGAEKARDLGPADIDWLARRTGLPVVVKGVLRPDDAVRCVHAGASAVWVSTHGGRQLDRAVSTATALPLVREAVGDGCEVYVDGGIRSGLDVVTALAAGADAAFLGRLPVQALTQGEEGVSRMHTHLAAEVEEALRLCGARLPREARGLLAPS